MNYNNLASKLYTKCLILQTSLHTYASVFETSFKREYNELRTEHNNYNKIKKKTKIIFILQDI